MRIVRPTYVQFLKVLKRSKMRGRTLGDVGMECCDPDSEVVRIFRHAVRVRPDHGRTPTSGKSGTIVKILAGIDPLGLWVGVAVDEVHFETFIPRVLWSRKVGRSTSNDQIRSDRSGGMVLRGTCPPDAHFWSWMEARRSRTAAHSDALRLKVVSFPPFPSATRAKPDVTSRSR
jgi:hypothetical protein